MTNTRTPQQQPVELILTDLRSLGIVRPRACGDGVMIAGTYLSRSEAETMVARYRRAAARRAALVGVTR